MKIFQKILFNVDTSASGLAPGRRAQLAARGARMDE